VRDNPLEVTIMLLSSRCFALPGICEREIKDKLIQKQLKKMKIKKELLSLYLVQVRKKMKKQQLHLLVQ